MNNLVVSTFTHIINSSPRQLQSLSISIVRYQRGLTLFQVQVLFSKPGSQQGGLMEALSPLIAM